MNLIEYANKEKIKIPSYSLKKNLNDIQDIDSIKNNKNKVSISEALDIATGYKIELLQILEHQWLLYILNLNETFPYTKVFEL
jgi:hypothetical protein